MTIHIAGYYGHHNFGDDLLLSIVYSAIEPHSRNEKIRISCANPEASYLASWFPSAELVDPAQAKQRIYWGDTRVIFGGGGTLFDYTEKPSLRYISRRLLREAAIIWSAKLRGTRFMSIGLGIGPFHHSTLERICTLRLRLEDHTYVRDSESLRLAIKAGAKGATLGTDLCFLDGSKLRGIDARSQESTILIVIRTYRYGGAKNKYLSALLANAKRLEKDGHKVRWASFQPEYDTAVIEEIEAAGYAVWKWDPNSMRIDDAYAIFIGAKLVITARMHAIYIAGMLGIPCVGVSLHQKLKFASSFFENSITISDTPTEEQLSDAVQKMLSLETTDSSHAHPQEKSAIKMRDQLLEWLG